MNKKILHSTLLIALILATLSFPFIVSAAIPVSCLSPAPPGIEKVNEIMNRVIGVALGIGFALAVVGFIVAGIIYLTAAGGERMNIGKKALIAAVIGTALVALSQGYKIVTEIICKIING